MKRAKTLLCACSGLRSIALLIASMVCSVAAVAAQEPVAAPESVAVRSADKPSFGARPHPKRHVFFLTNAGAYVRLGDGSGGGPMRGIVDLCAMVNHSSKNAVGGSLFVRLDGDDFSAGPVLRWRRWLGPTRSLDVAVGTPIAASESIRPGSLLGLVKYNPVPWFGVAARPELVRYNNYIYGATGYRSVSGTKAQLNVGAEFGGKPGLVLGAGAAVVLGVMVALSVAVGSD